MNIQTAQVNTLVSQILEKDKAAAALRDAQISLTKSFKSILKSWPLHSNNSDHNQNGKNFARELRNLYISGFIEKEAMERIFKEIPSTLKPYMETAIAVRNAQEVLGTSNKKRLPLHEYIDRLLEDFEVAKRHATGEQQNKVNSAELEFKEKVKFFLGGKPQSQKNFPLRETLSGKIELKTQSQPAEHPAADVPLEAAAPKA